MILGMSFVRTRRYEAATRPLRLSIGRGRPDLVSAPSGAEGGTFTAWQ